MGFTDVWLHLACRGGKVGGNSTVPNRNTPNLPLTDLAIKNAVRKEKAHKLDAFFLAENVSRSVEASLYLPEAT